MSCDAVIFCSPSLSPAYIAFILTPSIRFRSTFASAPRIVAAFATRHLAEPTDAIQDVGEGDCNNLSADRSAVEEVLESLCCTALEQIGMTEQASEGGRVIDAGCLYVDCGKIIGVGVGGREIEEEYVSFPIQQQRLEKLEDAVEACGGEVSVYSSNQFNIFGVLVSNTTPCCDIA